MVPQKTLYVIAFIHLLIGEIQTQNVNIVKHQESFYFDFKTFKFKYKITCSFLQHPHKTVRLFGLLIFNNIKEQKGNRKHLCAECWTWSATEATTCNTTWSGNDTPGCKQISRRIGVFSTTPQWTKGKMVYAVFDLSNQDYAQLRTKKFQCYSNTHYAGVDWRISSSSPSIRKRFNPSVFIIFTKLSPKDWRDWLKIIAIFFAIIQGLGMVGRLLAKSKIGVFKNTSRLFPCKKVLIKPLQKLVDMFYSITKCKKRKKGKPGKKYRPYGGPKKKKKKR